MVGQLTRLLARNDVHVKRLKEEQGQALVEFALILPVLLVILIGFFDFGSAWNNKNDLNFLANQAARYAEVNQCKPCSSGQSIAAYVRSTADTNHLKDPTVTRISFCLPAPSGGGTNDGSAGNPLRVTVSANYNSIGFLQRAGLPSLRGGTIPLSTTVTTRILQKSDGTLYTAAAC